MVHASFWILRRLRVIRRWRRRRSRTSAPEQHAGHPPKHAPGPARAALREDLRGRAQVRADTRVDRGLSLSGPARKSRRSAAASVQVDGDIGTVGITDFAQKELGEVVLVELPTVGDSFEAKASFGDVASVKASSDVNAPVRGTIIEVKWCAAVRVRAPLTSEHG
eukprot:scaffold48_cov311-Pinguiococcus_pyrenoidosus.AAC.83